MAVQKKNPTLEARHDAELMRVQDAAVQCGLTFVVRERTTPTLTAVTLQVVSMKSPPLYGIVTPYGFSLNLQDLMRITGPEKNKLRDVFTIMQRV